MEGCADRANGPVFRVDPLVFAWIVAFPVASFLGGIGVVVGMVGWHEQGSGLLLGFVPLFATCGAMYGRLLPRALERAYVSEEGLELGGPTGRRILRWSEISRERLAGGWWRAYSELRLRRAGDGAEWTVYCWYEGMGQLVREIVMRAPELASRTARYRGEVFPWHLALEPAVRLFLVFGAGSLICLLVLQSTLFALVHGTTAVVGLLGMSSIGVVSLPFRRREVRLTERALEVSTLLGRRERVEYGDLQAVTIGSLVPRDRLRTHLPTLFVDTRDGRRVAISSDVCTRFVDCYYELHRLWACASPSGREVQGDGRYPAA